MTGTGQLTGEHIECWQFSAGAVKRSGQDAETVRWRGPWLALLMAGSPGLGSGRMLIFRVGFVSSRGCRRGCAGELARWRRARPQVSRSRLSDDVCPVRLAAAGHRDVKQCPAQAFAGQGMACVHGPAPGSVHRRGVRQHRVFFEILTGHQESRTPCAVTGSGVNSQVTLNGDRRLVRKMRSPDPLYAPDVAVGGPPAVGVADGAVVTAGLDQVTDASRVVVAESDPGGLDQAGGD